MRSRFLARVIGKNGIAINFDGRRRGKSLHLDILNLICLTDIQMKMYQLAIKKSEFGQEIWNEALDDISKSRGQILSATAILLISRIRMPPYSYYSKATFYLVPSELCIFSLLIYALKRAGNKLLISLPLNY